MSTAIPAQPYTKCVHCELFVEINSDHADDPSLAPYLHLHRDTPADREIDSSHAPEPGRSRPLQWWRQHGPEEMRKRFCDSR